MSLWHLNILGTWIEVVNHLGKLLLLKNGFFEILLNDSDTVLLGKYM